MKKLCVFLMVIISVMCFNPALAEKEPVLNTGKSYLPPVAVDAPAKEASIQGCATFEYNGDDHMIVATTGGGANIYNLDKREIVSTHQEYNLATCWCYGADSKGNAYLAGSGLTIYNPSTDLLYRVGSLSHFGEYTVYAMCFDENDNVYMGTNPGGKIIKYDQQTGDYVNMGQLWPGVTAVHSIAYHNGYVYGGAYGTVDGVLTHGIIKMNINDPTDKKFISTDSMSESYDTYFLSVAGDYIIVTMNPADTVFAIDTKTDEIVTFDTDVQISSGFAVPSEDNKKAYFTLSGNLHTIDLETKNVTSEPLDPYIPSTIRNWGTKWVTIENNPDFPGKSLVSFRGDGYPAIINPETKKTMYYEELTAVKINKELDRIGVNPETGEIYMGTLANAQVTIYNPQTGETRIIQSKSQTDSILYHNGKMYFGCYPNAYLLEYDPKEPDKPPVILGNAEEHQYRVHDLCYGDNKIFMATIGDYNTLTGSLSWYDFDTKKITTKRLIENQSTTNVEYKDGIIYAATSIHGGHSATPTETAAKIYMYDVAKDKLLKAFTPKLPGFTEIPTINGMTFDKNGKLWCVTAQTLFSINPETEEITDILDLGKIHNSTTGTQTMTFDDDGYLYLNLGGITVVDLETLDYYKLPGANYPSTTQMFGGDGNLYVVPYPDGEYYVIPVVDFEANSDSLEETKAVFNDKIGLLIGNPLSYANGVADYIDSDNHNVVPFVEEGRTLVPVRYIAEALDAKVEWDKETQTVTLSKRKFNVKITINESKITVNEEEKEIDCPAKIENNRTFLPLRAISEAFEKKVFWDESGLIVISDEEQTFDENQVKLLNLYLKHYIKNDYEDQNYTRELNSRIKRGGMKEILLKNGDLEANYFRSNPIPRGFNPITQPNDNILFEVNENRVFEGKQALKIHNKIAGSSQTKIGLETDYIEVKPQKYYSVFNALYAVSGKYFNIAAILYDSDKIQIGEYSYSNYNFPFNVWNKMESIIRISDSMLSEGKTAKDVKYMKVQMYFPASNTEELYIDSIRLTEY